MDKSYHKKLFQLPVEEALQEVATRLAQLAAMRVDLRCQDKAIIDEAYEFRKLQDSLSKKAKRQKRLEEAGREDLGELIWREHSNEKTYTSG